MPRSDWCRRSLDAKQAARLVWRHELAAHGRSCDLVVRKAPSASKEGKSSLATFSEQGFGVACRDVAKAPPTAARLQSLEID